MQLDVFSRLQDGPRSAAAIAAVLGVDEDRLARLLHALVVAGLLEKRDTGFANTAETDAFLVPGRPDYRGGSHELLAQIWHADLQTARSIRSGAPAAAHDFEAASDEEMSAMLRGMHTYAVASGRDLVRRFDFSNVRSLVDVGGGSGGLVATVCDAVPGVDGILFELPRNARLAADILRAMPGGDRVTIEAGDILAAPPAGTHDAVVMRALVQVLGPDAAARAISHAAAALRPGGTLYIIGGGILDDDRLGPPSAVFLNITFLNLYRAGMAYTEAQHAAWLADAGCSDVRRTVLPSGGSIIAATRRAA
jgi:hypothetical protein